ncbi:hypothetical protein CASFOL_031562 [Castilleja foliolosa]|uniref:Nop domain-containing protein n=1 Tax=Castilleja foliolosa TaxID=1961234 RepID=A0ABD3C6F6_9LAMI
MNDTDNVNVEHKANQIEAHIIVDGESKLEYCYWFCNTMQKVENALEKGVYEDNELEYRFIRCCTSLSVQIDGEIQSLYCFIRDKCRRKLLELELLPQNPVDHTLVVTKTRNEMVKKIENEMDPKRRSLQSRIVDACERVLLLDPANKKLYNILEIQMRNLAPNLSALVGGVVASRLVVIAGGLAELAELPGCIIELFADGRRLPVTSIYHYDTGYLAQTEVFKRASSRALQKRCFRLLGAKANEAAVVDSTKGDPSGEKGRLLRAEIELEMLIPIRDLEEPPAGRRLGYLRSIRQRNPEAASWEKIQKLRGLKAALLRELPSSSET